MALRKVLRVVLYLRVSGRKQLQTDFHEDGLSLPAQRRRCMAHAVAQGWDVVDEYVERAETATSADRPALQEMLARIAERRDVDVVLAPKIDRIARNVADHYAIRAAVTRAGAILQSAGEHIDDTPSGRMVEGIMAVQAEFFSANLSTEIKKGMSQKARTGGWPHLAPVGYRNERHPVGDSNVAVIVPDPERAPLVAQGFDLYASGAWTIEGLDDEMHRRGMRNRRANRVGVNGWARILANPVYAGVVVWDSVEYPGIHEPLVDRATYEKVQRLLASRAARGTRERKHPHYLKGVLFCGVCGRRVSFMRVKDTYTYFYCLGRNTRNTTGCQERYVPSDEIEAQVEDLYERIALPKDLAAELNAAVRAEIDARQATSHTERTRLERQRAKVETQRRKLLKAYYAGAIDVDLLREEQSRLGDELAIVDDRLAALDATAGEWTAVLDTALRFATDCGSAYAAGSPRVRRGFNKAVFDRLEIRDGQIADVEYQAPFGGTKASGTAFKEQGKVAVDFYTEVRTIAMKPSMA